MKKGKNKNSQNEGGFDNGSFEGQAFNEKKIVRLSLSGNIIYAYFDGSPSPVNMWRYKTEAEGISKVNEITALINKREEEILKLQYHS